jgi:phage-related protein
VVSILGTLAGAVATVAGAIASLPAVLVAALAALVGFVAAYLTNWRGTRDKTNAIIGQIVDFVVGGFNTLASRAVDAVSGLAGDVRTFLSELAADIAAWGRSLGEDAFEWGKGLINGFIQGIRSVLSRVREFLGDLRDIGGDIGVSVPSLGGFGGGGGGGGGGTPTGRPPAGGVGSMAVQIDGRRLTEDTGRYLADPPRRQGL